VNNVPVIILLHKNNYNHFADEIEKNMYKISEVALKAILFYVTMTLDEYEESNGAAW